MRGLRRVFVSTAVGLVLACAAGAQSPKEVRKIAKQGPSALPELTRFLLNPDVKVRVEAVRGMIDIGGQRTLDPLVEATRDNDPQVQILAVNGLVNFYVANYVRTGFAAPLLKMGTQIRSRFSDPDDQVVDLYVKARPAVIQAIGRVARSGSSLDSRANAARAIGVLRGKAAVPDLIEALRSRDSNVLIEALNALEKIRDPAACPGMRYLIRDLDEKVQVEAIEANGVVGCKDANPDLREVLRQSGKDRVQRAAISALAMMPEPVDRTLFTNFLNSPDEHMRTASAEGFARLASINDARSLQAQFDAETRNMPRLALAFALVMDGNLALTEFSPLRYLIYSLNSSAYRQNASTYLTEAAMNPDVRLALYKVLDTGTRDEKVNLAKILAVSGDRGTVTELEKLSHDQDSVVSAEGVRQLRNLQSRI